MIKTDTVILALKKIARETGEDEDYRISELRRNANIFINIIDSNQNYYKSRIIIHLQKNGNNSNINQLLISRLIDKLKLNIQEINFPNGRRRFVLYYRISVFRINDNIFDDLKNTHKINEDYVSEKEWENIKETEIWSRCEIQVARELVADDISNFLYENNIIL